MTFGTLPIVGGIFEIASKYSHFKYPAVMVIDFLRYLEINDSNDNEIAKSQTSGRYYNFKAKLKFNGSYSNIQYCVLPLHHSEDCGVFYDIGKAISYDGISSELITEEIKNGIPPRVSREHKIEILKKKHSYLFDQLGYNF